MQPPGTPSPSHQTEAILLHYWQVLKKRRIVVLAFTVVLTITVVIATLFSTPYYAATAVVEIAPKAPTVFQVEDVTDYLSSQTPAGVRSYYTTQYRIMQSRTVVARALDTLRSEHGVTEFDDREDPVASFAAAIAISPVPESHLVKISVEYPDPELAALFANVLAATYKEANLERALASGKQALDWLRDQHKVYRKRKYDSDQAVHDFKSEHDLMGLDEEYNSAMERLSMVHQAWSQVATERIESQAEYRELEALRNAEDWAPLAQHLALEHDVLQGLLRSYDEALQVQAAAELRYKPAHPEMVRVMNEAASLERQVEGQLADVVGGRAAELELLQNRERALKAEVDSLKSQAESLDKQVIDLKFLQAEAERNRSFYESLDRRMSEVDLAQVLKANNVRVIDPAIPVDKPIRPKLAVNVAMALALGLLGGCGLAFGMEYLDHTVKTREDIEELIGIPLLGVVPAIDPGELAAIDGDSRRHLFVHTRPRSTVAECLRSVRTHLMFRLASAETHTLLITSAAPREGKSFTSSNLASIIAMSGKRVVLIDADLRRPALHKRFGMDNALGLADVFLGRVTTSEVIRHTEVEGLDLVVAGPPPANPGELLGGGRLERFLDDLRASYDIIIVDSPPVNVVADPLVIANVVDSVLLVVEANRTSRSMVVQATARLGEMNARLLGAVVNKLNLRTEGYGYYYYQGYGYYQSDDEIADEEAENSRLA